MRGHLKEKSQFQRIELREQTRKTPQFKRGNGISARHPGRERRKLRK
jgi:hypothetical protein